MICSKTKKTLINIKWFTCKSTSVWINFINLEEWWEWCSKVDLFRFILNSWNISPVSWLFLASVVTSITLFWLHKINNITCTYYHIQLFLWLFRLIVIHNIKYIRYINIRYIKSLSHLCRMCIFPDNVIRLMYCFIRNIVKTQLLCSENLSDCMIYIIVFDRKSYSLLLFCIRGEKNAYSLLLFRDWYS